MDARFAVQINSPEDEEDRLVSFMQVKSVSICPPWGQFPLVEITYLEDTEELVVLVHRAGEEPEAVYSMTEKES